MFVLCIAVVFYWSSVAAETRSASRFDEAVIFRSGVAEGKRRYAEANKKELEVIKRAQEALLLPRENGRRNDLDGIRPGSERNVASRSN